MELILVLADDLTGALEVAAKFAQHGVTPLVTTRNALPCANDVIVIDTETRHLPALQAAAKIKGLANTNATLIYKKTDSALRGNIGAELRALTEAFPTARLSYVPAYPQLGRTARNGHLLIDSVPVNQTVFALDPLNPVSTSSLVEILGDGLTCEIYDGETEDDVRSAVSTALARPGPHIIAGPASVAAAIAAQFNPAVHTPRWPHIKTCLIVNGSQHETSARQMESAIRGRCASPDPSAAWRIFSPEFPPGSTPLQVAAETGEALVGELNVWTPEALLVFGGDTAYGMLEAMGSPDLEALGEIVAGVPVSRIAGRDLYLITKAGSFGGDNLICQIRELLNGTPQ